MLLNLQIGENSGMIVEIVAVAESVSGKAALSYHIAYSSNIKSDSVLRQKKYICIYFDVSGEIVPDIIESEDDLDGVNDEDGLSEDEDDPDQSTT